MSPFSQWKTIGYAIAIFAAGAISGGALTVYEVKQHLFTPPREQDLKLRMLTRLENKLVLTPDQVEKVSPILDSAVSQLHSIRTDTFQRVNKVFEDSYTQISAILTPEQRVKLAVMEKERLEMMQLHQNHRHPGDGDHDGPGGAASPQ
jgi:hypothetical protein